MTPRLRAFPKVQLTIEILLAYARVRWLLWRHGVRPTLDALRGERAAAPQNLLALDDTRLASATARVLQLLPTDGRCLMRSLVLLALLARRGRDATLMIGVEPGRELRAHSWLETDGRPILPTEGFPPLAAL
jgi:hypothetical protein